MKKCCSSSHKNGNSTVNIESLGKWRGVLMVAFLCNLTCQFTEPIVSRTQNWTQKINTACFKYLGHFNQRCVLMEEHCKRNTRLPEWIATTKEWIHDYIFFRDKSAAITHNSSEAIISLTFSPFLFFLSSLISRCTRKTINPPWADR